MGVAAQSIFDQAGYLFNDTGGVFWTDAELLIWLNMGQKAIVRLKPDANPVAESMALASGTRQALPDGRLALIDVPRNMGADGSTPGRVVRQISRRDMDAQDPFWHAREVVTDVEYFMFDERDPATFFVSPPSNGSGQVEVVASDTPADVAAKENDITLPDIYADVLLDYILYRGFSKNGESTAHRQRALDHYGACLQSLGRQDMAEMIYSPNMPAEARLSNMMTTPGGGQQQS